MNEPVYTPNSHKYKEQQKAAAANTEEKHVTKVVKNPAKTKTNEVRRLADIFISEDVSNVKEYILMDVLVPAIKKAIYDIVTNGIDMFLYGGKGGNRGGSNVAKVSYGNYYSQKNNVVSNRGSESNKSDNVFRYEDLVFDNRGDAEAVKQQLQESVAKYGIVNVGDLYEYAGLEAPYTAQKYGWMDLRSAEVQRYRGNYILKLPKAMPID